MEYFRKPIESLFKRTVKKCVELEEVSEHPTDRQLFVNTYNTLLEACDEAVTLKSVMLRSAAGSKITKEFQGLCDLEKSLKERGLI